MKHREIKNMLDTLGIPVAYNFFPTDKKVIPPFIAYRDSAVTTFKADGKTYYRPYQFEIELVTIKKDVALEETIEELLTENNIPYDKAEEVWDEEEKIYHNYYEI